MDEKRKRLIAHALNEATRGCTCGMGVAECDRCREVVLVEALDEATAKLAKVVASFDAYLNSEDEDRVAEWIALCESIKAAKVQP